MGTTLMAVKAIAAWDGWCDPCGTERPLVLTESGARGVRAWLTGVSWEDRSLGLYCRVCGQHQDVPLHEEDDPPVVVPELVTSLVRTGAITVVLARGEAAAPWADARVPAPRSAPSPAPSPTSISLPDTASGPDRVLVLVA